MRIAAIASLLLLAAAACGDSEPPPARTPPAPGTTTLTAKPAATATVVAIATPVPTSTPTPTAVPARATRTPTPTATASPPPPAPTSTPSPAPRPTPAATPGPVALSPAFNGRLFQRPIELGAYPRGRVFVAEQDGAILLLDEGGSAESVLLDLRSTVRRSGNEEGLLSVALDPNFEANGWLYAYYSASGPRRSVLARFAVTDDVADPESALVVIEVAQPFSNHNGGAVRFGPDGMLYLGFGDGGAAGDPLGNGQDRSTLLGTIIRIDVREASEAEPYRIPPDNPFLNLPNARPEVWAYGLRNPWRMAFDPATGALWAADVGQDLIEEVDIIEAGGNYGWNRLEGGDCYPARSRCDPGGTVAPVATYTHAEGCSVSGGVVYRGSALPSIDGTYLYGDFCSGRVWALPAGLGSGPAVVAESGRAVSSFGVDGDGDVYLLVFEGPILRLVEAR